MIRLAKYIADAGVCSRRAACRLIEAGEVEVNGKAALHTDRVSSGDAIVVQGRKVQKTAGYVYCLYNKPVGIDCVCNESDSNSIVHCMPSGSDIPRLFPVGRLDKDSRGLILLTNHGELCQRILHPDFYHEKEYLVELDRAFDSGFCQQMSAGVSYGTVTTKPCVVTPVNSKTFRIVLTQGLNRQIRRMCQSFGYQVINLQRTRMMSLLLDELPESGFRWLMDDDIRRLKNGLNFPVK